MKNKTKQNKNVSFKNKLFCLKLVQVVCPLTNISNIDQTSGGLSL